MVGILPSFETMGSTLVLLAFSGVALQANFATMVSWQRGRCSPLFLSPLVLLLCVSSLRPHYISSNCCSPFGVITCIALPLVTLTDVFVAVVRTSYWTGIILLVLHTVGPLRCGQDPCDEGGPAT